MPTLLSVAEYAKRNGVSTQSVYARIARGTLDTKYIKVKALRIVVRERVKSE